MTRPRSSLPPGQRAAALRAVLDCARAAAGRWLRADAGPGPGLTATQIGAPLGAREARAPGESRAVGRAGRGDGAGAAGLVATSLRDGTVFQLTETNKLAPPVPPRAGLIAGLEAFDAGHRTRRCAALQTPPRPVGSPVDASRRR